MVSCRGSNFVQWPPYQQFTHEFIRSFTFRTAGAQELILKFHTVVTQQFIRGLCAVVTEQFIRGLMHSDHPPVQKEATQWAANSSSTQITSINKCHQVATHQFIREPWTTEDASSGGEKLCTFLPQFAIAQM